MPQLPINWKRSGRRSPNHEEATVKSWNSVLFTAEHQRHISTFELSLCLETGHHQSPGSHSSSSSEGILMFPKSPQHSPLFHAGRAKSQMWTEPFEFFIPPPLYFLAAPRCHIVSAPRPHARRLDNLPIVAPPGEEGDAARRDSLHECSLSFQSVSRPA